MKTWIIGLLIVGAGAYWFTCKATENVERHMNERAAVLASL
jgi:hypothetical protein